MKYFFIFFFLFISSSEVSSQILNSGFEDWTTQPVGWSYIPGFYDEVSQLQPDSDAHSGKYCVFYHFTNPSQNHDLHYRAFLVNTDSNGTGGFRIPEGKNFYLSFWYKAIYTSVGNGRIGMSVGINITENGKKIGSFDPGLEKSATWTRASEIYITGSDSLHADSLQLFFNFDADGAYKIDVQFYLDDLVLDSVSSSVPFPAITKQTYVSIFPNPISSHANLNYHLDGRLLINASIFDPTGRRVMIFPSVSSASIDGSIPFDCEGLPNGIYYLKFEAGGNILMKKIIVQH